MKKEEWKPKRERRPVPAPPPELDADLPTNATMIDQFNATMSDYWSKVTAHKPSDVFYLYFAALLNMHQLLHRFGSLQYLPQWSINCSMGDIGGTKWERPPGKHCTKRSTRKLLSL